MSGLHAYRDARTTIGVQTVTHILRIAFMALMLAAGAAGVAGTAGLFDTASAQTAPAASGATPQGAVPQAPASFPPRQAVTEDQLLRELNRLEGRVSIPDGKSAMLEQPQGRDWRRFKEGALPWIAGIAVLGMVLLLAGFYFVKGRMRLQPGELSGVKILRFNVFERFMHWLVATSFIVLALSGLNYIFGKRLLMPLIGPDAFAALSQWGKYAHNYLAWPFMLGILFMLFVWVKDNIPNKVDVRWVKEGGGFVGSGHPSAGRFNAGQKLVFWIVMIGGIAMSVSGIMMLFPFSATDVAGMQWSQIIHAVIGVLFIAAILAHIYIGSVGMEGAYDAMGSGEVDLAWAKKHHDLWVEEQQAKTASGPQLGGRPAPAE